MTCWIVLGTKILESQPGSACVPQGVEVVHLDTVLKDSWKAAAAVNHGYGFQSIILGVHALMGGGIVTAYFPVV